MSTLVLMKAFEAVPSRYDFGMRLITFGGIDRLRREIVERIPENARVLEIGCGTGELLPLLARRRVHITAIDKDPEMVRTARERASAENILSHVEINRNTALEIDRLFAENEFDAVVLSLVMSELTSDERAWVVNQCARILKANGSLIVADEFQPSATLKRLAFSMLRFPLHLITFLYTQIKHLNTTNVWWKIYYTVVEFPLMLLSFFVGEPLTRPVKMSEVLLPRKLRVVSAFDLSGGMIRMLELRKEESLL